MEDGRGTEGKGELTGYYLALKTDLCLDLRSDGRFCSRSDTGGVNSCRRHHGWIFEGQDIKLWDGMEGEWLS